MVKNICFLAPHTRISGGTRVIFRIADLLGKNGYNVNVVVPKFGNMSAFSLFTGKHHFSVYKNPNFDPSQLPHHDVLIDFCDNPIHVKTKAPRILFLQGFGTQNFDLELGRLKTGYDHVICVSSWLQKIVRSAGLKHTTIIPPGIDQIFRPTRNPLPRLVSIGAIYHGSEAKNLKIFLEALQRMYSRNNKSRAVFVSARPMTNLDHYGFEYSSFINPPQFLLPTIYSNCDIWVNTSINEGFGLPTLEAMACGCPVISLKNFGLDDYLIDKKNCLLLPTKATGMDLYNSMVELLNNSVLRKVVIKSGLELSKKFSWKNTMNAWLQFLGGI